MDPERKGFWSASSDGDGSKENKLKQGISQDLASSPKLDRYKIARQLTEKAIKEKKIFSIYGHYPVVRAALRRKGWVEKKFHFLPRVIPDFENGSTGVTDDKHAEVKENRETALERTEDIHDVMSRLVKNEMPYLLWTIKRDVIDYHNLTCDQMLNHYAKTASFTTKIGLCVNMRSLPWYVPANPDSFFPRCYSLCTDSEQQEFLDDFRRTMASSILKWVVSHQSCSRSKPRAQVEEAESSELSSRTGVWGAGPGRAVPGRQSWGPPRGPSCLLGMVSPGPPQSGACLVGEVGPSLGVSCTFRILLCSGDAFISNSRSYFPQCQALLNKITSVNPQTDIDGLRNIWIIKPAAKSRGRDIVCMDRVEEILKLVAAEHPPSRDNKWVVQKYIETPMLIYDTKFDIRQWFLVTDWNPLTIWFYKESYLRFSTQRFSLDKLDSAIHLCNNAVQKHLKNDVGRSPLLPAHNMWTSARFQEYLQRRGRGATWGSVIYPSMKAAIAHVMKVAQDHVEPRKNSFELYGADFVLGRDFRPWLIEINSSPTMHPSTPVTAQLCAKVQEDTIKVAVDRSCDIGNFELLWRQPAVELPPFSGSDLCVAGIGVRRARRQVLPVCNLKASASLWDAQPLKAQCPLATLDPTQGPTRLALQRDLGLKDEKGLPVALLAPLKRPAESGRAAQPTRTKAAGKAELPACLCRHVDSQALNTGDPEAQPTRYSDPNLFNVHPLVPVLQGLKTEEGALRPPPGAPGNVGAVCSIPNPPSPAAAAPSRTGHRAGFDAGAWGCRGTPERLPRVLRATAAPVLQGTSFVPMGWRSCSPRTP
ncbi:protein monoglycylase TTLL8 [Sapajus apella]|uniref:Protein monoglycylase TTLL8 n=1 Tax=Sapajus apella TaxID=9515 RepID=A0A6J3GV04_SAPAP|nr:protein monoglycylase TTLL8 [Sapajus apella]